MPRSLLTFQLRDAVRRRLEDDIKDEVGYVLDLLKLGDEVHPRACEALEAAIDARFVARKRRAEEEREAQEAAGRVKRVEEEKLAAEKLARELQQADQETYRRKMMDLFGDSDSDDDDDAAEQRRKRQRT